MKNFFTTVIFLFISFSFKGQTFTWNGFSPIYDLQTDTIPIVVTGLPNVIDTNFGVAHICMNITHTYKGDLLMKMVSPTGTIVTLIQNNGGANDNYLGTCMGMDGTAFSNSQAPYTGLFLPVGNISLFNNGQNPNGTWLFLISDQANVDTGSVHSASIAFVNNPPRASGSGGGGGGPTGTYNCASCVCPGGAGDCDLLPDMTSSAKEISMNHNEVPGALYISNATPNIGFGPLDIYGIDSCFCGTTYVPCGTICPNGDNIKHFVKQRIYQKLPGVDSLGYYDRLAGTMTYHSTHGHIHVDNWAYYTLRTATSNPDATTWPIVGTGVKQSFCLVNLGTCGGNNGECLDNNGNILTTVPNQNLGFHTGCGLNQGIYPGNYDVYSISLNDPIPLTNICNGNYYVVSITDPSNNFLESDETNNWVAVPITLTQQNVSPTITAGGPTTFCLGGSVTLTSNSASNYVWSTGATTQSIVVSASGNYTVSSNCGTSTATSLPITVTVKQLDPIVTASPATINCNGDPVQLSASAASAGTQNVPVVFTSSQQVFIPDNVAAGVTSSISVTGINPATVSASSVVSVKLNLTHTYDGDLAISLISPSGNSIFLSNRRGSGGDNFINTVFSMSAATLIANGSAPFTGTYKPDGNYSSFTGNVNGTWQLKVQDLASVDTGRIQNWSLTINNAIPETLNYSWSSLPAGFSSTNQNPVLNPSATATYSVVVTSSASGCTGSQSVQVVVPGILSITNFAPMVATPGTVVTINGSGFNNITGVTVAGNTSAFSIINNNQLQLTIPNVATTTGVVCVTNANNCSYCSSSTITISRTVNLTLKLFIEGYYLGSSLMQASIDAFNFPNLCDTVTVELRNSTSPNNVAFTQRGIMNINGNCTLLFPNAAAGNSYYIAVHHRNAIETWSSSPVFMNDNTNYDFTDARSKAYGNNLSDLGDGKFGFYSGDVSDIFTGAVGIQDGVIESQDYADVENALTTILSGYVYEDITGDNVVESADYSLVENNVSFIITVHRP